MNLNIAICDAIESSKKEIEEGDLLHLNSEYSDFLRSQINEGKKKVMIEIPIPRIVEPESEKSDSLVRYIVVGDTHSDFNSLRAILFKLMYSREYDYFSNASFIFLGDYFDRGSKSFQYFRLLFKLKNILKERLIFLQGNHETLYFDENDIHSGVKENDTSVYFNLYLTPEVKRLMVDFFSTLPYFVLLQTQKDRHFIVHGGIPKDSLSYSFDLPTLKDLELPLPYLEKTNKQIFQNLIWGDPSTYDFKLQNDEIRFEFGRKQFESFAERNGITHMIRSHEAVARGHQSMFDGKLDTVFSTGGKVNDQTYYSWITDPAFCIITEDGTMKYENIFTYSYGKSITGNDNYLLYNEKSRPFFLISSTPMEGFDAIKINETLSLNDEFFLDPENKGLYPEEIKLLLL